MPPKRQKVSVKMFTSEGMRRRTEDTTGQQLQQEKKAVMKAMQRSGSCSDGECLIDRRRSSSIASAPESARSPNVVPSRHGVDMDAVPGRSIESADNLMNTENDATHIQMRSVTPGMNELSHRKKRRRVTPRVEESTLEGDQLTSIEEEKQPPPKNRKVQQHLREDKIAGGDQDREKKDPAPLSYDSSRESDRIMGQNRSESRTSSIVDQRNVSQHCLTQTDSGNIASQQSIHTPTTFMCISQTSIDTPPVGVSRLPSPNGALCPTHHPHADALSSSQRDVDMFSACHSQETQDMESKTSERDDGNMQVDYIDSDAVGRSPFDSLSFPVDEDLSTPVDLPTPMPVLRSSMPPSLRLPSPSTPRLIRQTPQLAVDQQHVSDSTVGTQGGACSDTAESDGDAALSNHDRDAYEPGQPRPNVFPLFGDSPMTSTITADGHVDGDAEKGEDQADQEKLLVKRHTLDLGSITKANRKATQVGRTTKGKGATPWKQSGQTELAWNKTTKEFSCKRSKPEQQEVFSMDTVSRCDKDVQRHRTDPLGDRSSSPASGIEDEIEETTQTDDGIERVDAKSTLGHQLLLAAATTRKTQEPNVASGATTTSSTTGSLFASARVTSKSQMSNDLASPAFDPSAFSADKALHSPANQTNKSLKFSFVALAFDQIEALKSTGAGSRKKAVTLLTNLLRLVLWWIPKDLVPVIYFCLNKVAPDYEGLEVGVGEAILIKVMVEVYGRNEASMKNDLKKHEDLGRVAELSRCSMRQLYKPPVLTIQSVFNALKSLPTVSGKHPTEQKKGIIKKLLASAEKSEPKCIIRFLQGKMRVGAQAATLYQALAFAFSLTAPSSSPYGSSSRSPCSDIRRASKKVMTQGDIDSLLSTMEIAVRAALSEVSNVELVVQRLFEGCTASTLPIHCTVMPGFPVQPMLAKPTKGLEEVLARFSDSEFTCEFKYDGERVQLHVLPNGNIASEKSIKLFSRNLETLTHKYPDIVRIAKEALQSGVKECIMDCEVVAYDSEAQKIQPFQMLATRKRKGVEAESIAVPVCLMAFDCIQFNGQSLTKHPLEDRRKYLHQCITEVPNKFMFARHSEMSSLEEIDSFFNEAVEANCEGLMVKTLHHNASYEPSKRSLNWLKIKKDYLQHLTDSVDLVPLGAYLGRGKRSKWYGAYLLACYNEDEEVYQTVCKVGTGFSEENLQEFYNYFKSRIISTKHPSYQVEDKLMPDVWFEPSVVWEVRAADLSISPLHTGGIGLKHPERGIGLRFPRFMRVRDDKKPAQATSHIQIVEMYENQFNNYDSKNGQAKIVTKDDDDDDDNDDNDDDD